MNNIDIHNVELSGDVLLRIAKFSGWILESKKSGDIYLRTITRPPTNDLEQKTWKYEEFSEWTKAILEDEKILTDCFAFIKSRKAKLIDKRTPVLGGYAIIRMNYTGLEIVDGEFMSDEEKFLDFESETYAGAVFKAFVALSEIIRQDTQKIMNNLNLSISLDQDDIKN